MTWLYFLSMYPGTCHFHEGLSRGVTYIYACTLGTQNILFESLALIVLTQGIPVFDHLQHAEGENSLRMRLSNLV